MYIINTRAAFNKKQHISEYMKDHVFELRRKK